MLQPELRVWPVGRVSIVGIVGNVGSCLSVGMVGKGGWWLYG